jgi:hypothetical protein
LALVSPVALPYRPAAHCPLHVATLRPAVAPYVPGGQSVHDADPGREYLPAGHRAAVADVDPATHA